MPLAQPAGRVRAALDVAGEQLDAGEQAADAAHVAVAVAADLVADAVQGQRLVLERLQRLEALLERERRRLPRRARTSVGTTPLGLNMTTSRCFRCAWLAKPRLGRLRTNGRAAAPMPRSRRNSRRVRVQVHASDLRRKAGDGGHHRDDASIGSSDESRRCAAGSRRLRLRVRRQRRVDGDLDHQLADIEAVLGERFPQLVGLRRPVGPDRLLDQVVEQLLDEGVVRLLAVGQERRQVAAPRRTSPSRRRGSGSCRSRRSACRSPSRGSGRRRRSAPG